MAKLKGIKQKNYALTKKKCLVGLAPQAFILVNQFHPQDFAK